MTFKSEVIADGGHASQDGEFFRSPSFLAAEGVTHTLRVFDESADLRAPIIVRAIGGTEAKDAVSPYGFPGFSGSGMRPIDPREVDFAATGLVSVFLRHRLDEVPLAGATERAVVLLADPALTPKRRSSDRNRINKNQRAGYRVRLVPGPETTPADRAGLLAAYQQTMRRAGAAERYLFGAAHFERLLASPASWLALADAPDGGVAAASLTVRSDGFLHYYLSGTADANLSDSPMKNVVAALADHAAELGLPLNLGGGMTRGDRLEEFKRGFANRELPWRTSEIVCDPEAYARLSAGRPDTGFFPRYRA